MIITIVIIIIVIITKANVCLLRSFNIKQTDKYIKKYGFVLGNCGFVLIISIRQRCSNSPQAINDNRIKQIESLFPAGNQQANQFSS